MVLLGGGKPDSVVCAIVALVTEDEDDLVLNIDGETAEHGPRYR